MDGTQSTATRREFLKMTAAVAGAGVLGATSLDAQEGTKLPNIVLLMADQFRGDCLGCDGNTAIRTPNLDRIAREGARFSRAYSSTPTCTPARACLLTGMAPWNHGMIAYGRVAPRYSVELPRLMSAAGYFTYAVGKLHYHPQRNLHGFDGALIDESGRVESPDFVSDYRKWFKEQAPESDADATGIGWNDYRSRVYALSEDLHPTRWTGDRAVDFITDYSDSRPFMLKVSFARPHSPYDPPRRFMEMYNEADMPAPKIGDWASRFAAIRDPDDYNAWHGDFGIGQARSSRRGYYGSVSFIDEQVGRILGALDAKGLLESTLVIFLADHGDMTGDHHLWRKSYAYEGSARVPMLMRWPERLAPGSRRGLEIREVTEIRDILPTLLDAAQASVPERIDGQSLLRLVREPEARWRAWIDLEHGVCYDKTNHWTALTDGRWKYIHHAFDGSEQLFNLDEDPGEKRDLVADSNYNPQREEWRQRMVRHLEIRGDGWVREGALVAPRENQLYSPNYPGTKT